MTEMSACNPTSRLSVIASQVSSDLNADTVILSNAKDLFVKCQILRKRGSE